MPARRRPGRWLSAWILSPPRSAWPAKSRLGIRARNGGIFLMVTVVVIVSLMAGKPTI
jgi:hypothetical protein